MKGLPWALNHFMRARFLVGNSSPPVDGELADRSGLTIDDRAKEFGERFEGRNLWQHLLWSVRSEVVWYATAGIAAIVVAPLMLYTLRLLLERLGSTRGPEWIEAALWLSAAVTGYLVVTRVREWRERRALLAIRLVAARALFSYLQEVSDRWLKERGLSPLAYITTHSNQLSQVIYVVDFAITSVYIGILVALLFVWFEAGTLGVLAGVAALTVAARSLIIAIGHVYHAYVERDHERVRFIEVLANSWPTIRRQNLDHQVNLGINRVRSNQRSLIRRRAHLQALSRTIEDSATPLVAIVVVGLVVLLEGDVALILVLPLLASAKMVMDAVDNNLANYRVLRITLGPTREIEHLYRQAPRNAASSPARHNVSGSITITTPYGETHNISCPIRLAVVGATGTGKTTLLEALASASQRGGWSGSCPGTVILVPRAQPPLGGSIAEQVTIWQQTIPELYRQALDDSALTEVILGKPEGDSTEVSVSNAVLSEGQSQRIAIAQALYFKPDLLMLDDVFAPLDPVTAEEVSSRVLQFGSDRSVVFVTSRLEVARHSDAILLLGDSSSALVAPSEITNSVPESIRRAEAVVGHDMLESIRSALSSHPETDIAVPLLDNSNSTSIFPVTDRTEAADAIDRTPRPTLWMAARGLLSLFTVAHLALVVVASAIAVGAEVLTIQSIEQLDRPVELMWTLAVLVVIAIMSAALRYAVAFHAPVHPVYEIHRRLVQGLLSSTSTTRRASTAGRLTQDFHALELEVPNASTAVLATVVQAGVYVTILLLANPLTGIVLLPLVVWAAATFRRGRQALLDSERLTARVRDDVAAFASVAQSGPGYRLSPPLRNAIRARFEHLVHLQADAGMRAALAAFRVRTEREAVATGVFLCTVWAAVLSPATLYLAPAVLVFVGYDFSRRTTAVLERLYTSATWQLQLARLSEILSDVGLPARNELKAPSEALTKATEESVPESPKAAGVEARDLTVKRGNADVLNGISLEVAPGSAVALIGPSGAGKSTLLQAIAGAIPFESGTVQVDGCVPDNNSMMTHKRVHLLDSDVPLLPLPIKEFLDQGSACSIAPSRTLTEVFAAAGLTCPSLDEKMDELNHGQRQLVNLSRALAGNPSLLLLDEALAALDTESEARIVVAIKEVLAPDATCIVALHRPDNQGYFDRVVAVGQYQRVI